MPAPRLSAVVQACGVFRRGARCGSVSLAWRRLDLLGRKRSRQRWGAGLTGSGCGALRAGFAGLDALVVEEQSNGSEVRHDDEDGIEQGLCDPSVRQAELGIVDGRGLWLRQSLKGALIVEKLQAGRLPPGQATCPSSATRRTPLAVLGGGMVGHPKVWRCAGTQAGSAPDSGRSTGQSRSACDWPPKAAPPRGPL